MVKLSTVDLEGIAFLAPGPRDPAFPARFFDRIYPTPDARFYDSPRLVTHIDRAAIEAVGALALGLNDVELRHNRQAAEVVVRDLDADPTTSTPSRSTRTGSRRTR